MIQSPHFCLFYFHRGKDFLLVENFNEPELNAKKKTKVVMRGKHREESETDLI